MKRILLILSALLTFSGLQSASADLVIYPPVLEKVVINSDSMMAVLYWKPAHSAPDNPILGYAYTYDGNNFVPFDWSYQRSAQLTFELPYRSNATPYIFAIAVATKNGYAPISNRIKAEINPYTIPINLSAVTPMIDGFSFWIKDVTAPGWTSKTYFRITDIEGSSTAYVNYPKGDDYVEIRGVLPGQDVSITLSKIVTNCQGFSSFLPCPYSTALVIKASALKEIPAPTVEIIKNLSDGFVWQVTNFDRMLKYSFETPPGISASIDDSGMIEVHGYPSGTNVSLKIRASHSPYADAVVELKSKTTGESYVPSLGGSVSTHTGFYIPITNYRDTVNYSVTSTSGKVSINSDGVISVTGISPGASATVTLSVLQEKETIYQLTTQGTSKKAKAPAKTTKKK